MAKKHNSENSTAYTKENLAWTLNTKGHTYNSKFHQRKLSKEEIYNTLNGECIMICQMTRMLPSSVFSLNGILWSCLEQDFKCSYRMCRANQVIRTKFSSLLEIIFAITLKNINVCFKSIKRWTNFNDIIWNWFSNFWKQV